jgi:hypothetical protein
LLCELKENKSLEKGEKNRENKGGKRREKEWHIILPD